MNTYLRNVIEKKPCVGGEDGKTNTRFLCRYILWGVS